MVYPASVRPFLPKLETRPLSSTSKTFMVFSPLPGAKGSCGNRSAGPVGKTRGEAPSSPPAGAGDGPASPALRASLLRGRGGVLMEKIGEALSDRLLRDGRL